MNVGEDADIIAISKVARDDEEEAAVDEETADVDAESVSDGTVETETEE
jgi:hypothetical protein